MKITAVGWSPGSGWRRDDDDPAAQIVLYFAAPSALAGQDVHGALRDLFPKARILGCSTGGEIAGADVNDESVSAVAIRFDSSHAELAEVRLADFPDSRSAGAALARRLPVTGLRAAFVLADGVQTNGTGLVQGMREVLPADVLLTGGLAGDGPHFQRTFVGADKRPTEGVAAVLGLYGESLRLGWGSYGGWEPFGPASPIWRPMRPAAACCSRLRCVARAIPRRWCARSSAFRRRRRH